jgi:hypothetical protein
MKHRSKIRAVVSNVKKESPLSDRVLPFPVPTLPVKRPELTNDEIDALLQFQKEHSRLFHWFAHVITEGVIETLLRNPGAPGMPMLRRGPHGLFWETSPQEGGAS